MDATMSEPEISDRPAAADRGWLWLLAALALAFVVHAPSLGLSFVGDDFEWWLEAVRRMKDPLRLASPYGGLRLTNPVLLMPDLALWKDWIPGWHITNLTIHGAVMGLLFGVGRRLGLSAPVAALVVAVWGTSPYTAFQVREIHPRHDPLLLACWLGIGLVWPGRGERWTPRRAVAAGTLALVSGLTKESWVVLPGFVAAYESAMTGSSLGRVVRTAALWSVGPVLYVGTYILLPAVAGSYAAAYYSGGLAAGAKIPSTFAVFCGLCSLDVTSLRFGPVEWLSLVVLAGVTAITARTREPVLILGLALFFLPFVPVIPVGFMTGSYAYVPLAGFLLLAVGLARIATDRAPSAFTRWLILCLTGLAALALVVAGLRLIGKEMSDAERRDEGHRRLLEEALLFWPQVPRDRPLVCVRLESTSINSRLLGTVEGLPKAYFERATYPYGLVRWAELLSWTGWQRGGPLWEEVHPGTVEPGPFAVVGHVDGRFVLLQTDASSAAAAAARWAEGGFPVRLIRALAAD